MNGVLSEGVLAALRWLDGVCERAVHAAQAIYGAPDDPYRGLYVSDADVARILASEPGVPVFGAVDGEPSNGLPLEQLPPFDRLARLFDLSDFDLKILLIACATALDSRYERLFAYLQDDVTRKQATVDLALNLLCSTLGEKLSRRAHFAPAAPLIRQGLVALVADPNAVEPSPLSYFLKPDEQIVSLILGLDLSPSGGCEVVKPSLRLDDLPLAVDLKRALARLVVQSLRAGKQLRLYFSGAPGTGKRQAAEAVAFEFGQSLLVVGDAALEAGLAPHFRQAKLTRSVLYVAGTPRDPAEFGRLLADHDGAVIAAGAAPPAGMVTLTFSRPNFRARRAGWTSALIADGIHLSETELDRLAALKLSGDQICAVVRQAVDHARWVTEGDPSLADYFAAAGTQSGGELAALAQKISPLYRWDDIVLPDDVLLQLVELCQRVEQGHRVMEDWGFRGKLSQGRGITALFAGPSGTGKTMATEIIANHLHLDLYRIDLAGVVSKYIGETEKNLDRIFNAAEHTNAILLFDEADALFGKRSEVRDSHDRYANLEISYLLQKMEQFDGVAILTTNLRGNLDDAFTRRLAFTVYFPFPDEADRERIWSGIWPQAAPLGDDVDLALLARKFRLSGGSIRNIALAGAFFAAADGGTIRMEHLLRATQREYGKMGKLLTEAELAGGVS